MVDLWVVQKCLWSWNILNNKLDVKVLGQQSSVHLFMIVPVYSCFEGIYGLYVGCGRQHRQTSTRKSKK
jgi:hypothetical protein